MAVVDLETARGATAGLKAHTDVAKRAVKAAVNFMAGMRE